MSNKNLGVPASLRFDPACIELMQEIIASHAGNEVLFVGVLDEGLVVSVRDLAHGSRSMVPVMPAQSGEVLIHNHPSGLILPSDADVRAASHLVADGIGSWIVDSLVSRVYIITEPYTPKKLIKIDGINIDEVFDNGGLLSKQSKDYQARPGQITMAHEVLKGFNDECIIACEAGTGVGKSFAYLVPALLFSTKNEERVVISTATINLQEQLIQKDLPFIAKALGLEVKVALAKGRGNYLCLKRLHEAIDEEGLLIETNPELKALKEFSETTVQGSKSDLIELVEDAQWSRVNADADLCTGLKCPYRDDCFFFKARREVANAQIVVANHHLVFADTAMRSRGLGYDGTVVLPAFSRIIFDEAHSIEQSATNYFSDEINRLVIFKYLALLHRSRGKRVFGLLPGMETLGFTSTEVYLPIIDRIKDSLVSFESVTNEVLREKPSLRLQDSERDENTPPVFGALGKVQDSLQELVDHLAQILEKIEEEDEIPSVAELTQVGRRLGSMVSSIHTMRTKGLDENRVLYLERLNTSRGDSSVNCTMSPLEIGGILRESLFEPYKTVVMTSATLQVRNSFDYFLRRIGLGSYERVDEFGDVVTNASPTYDLSTSSHASPFDYKKSVLLGIPADAPQPTSGEYQRYLETFIFEAIKASGGRALVLFTSYSSLNQSYENLLGPLNDIGIKVMRQRGMDRTRLLNQFRAETSSCLFGTDSFWEGVDVPGEALELVIICKLPFRQPDEPLFMARQEKIERHGGNSFMQLSVPDAVIKLRQGFGRLMRRESDFGVVLIPDNRIITKQYGKSFLESLPLTQKVTGSIEQITLALKSFLSERRKG